MADRVEAAGLRQEAREEARHGGALGDARKDVAPAHNLTPAGWDLPGPMTAWGLLAGRPPRSRPRALSSNPADSRATARHLSADPSAARLGAAQFARGGPTRVQPWHALPGPSACLSAHTDRRQHTSGTPSRWAASR